MEAGPIWFYLSPSRALRAAINAAVGVAVVFWMFLSILVLSWSKQDEKLLEKLLDLFLWWSQHWLKWQREKNLFSVPCYRHLGTMSGTWQANAQSSAGQNNAQGKGTGITNVWQPAKAGPLLDWTGEKDRRYSVLYKGLTHS